MILRVYVVLFAVFILAPILAISAGSLTDTSYVVFPPQGLTLKWYIAALGQASLLQSFGFSLLLGFISATIATLLATPLALAIMRYDSRINSIVYLIAMTPSMLPSVFLGLAFLIGYSWAGLGGTRWPLIAGHVVMAVPFALSLILVGLRSLDGTLERAARSLGAGPTTTFFRITLPLMSWSVLAGWGFAFLISFGSLEVSLFLSSTTTVTLPVQIYTSLDWNPLDPTLTAVSSGVVIVTLAFLVVLARIVRLDRFLAKGA